MKLSDGNIFYDKHGNQRLKVGNNNLFQNVEIEAPGIIASNCWLASGKIGAFTFINENVKIYSLESIGRFCSIAPGCIIGLPIHPIEALSSSDSFYNFDKWHGISNDFQCEDYARYKKDVISQKKFQVTPNVIGNEVWIGQNVMIMRGVKIGDGAIVAAGAVVTKDVEPYTIVEGVPAKVIRKRFSEEIIGRLLKMGWWDYGREIVKNIDFAHVSLDTVKQLEDKVASGFEKINPDKFIFRNKDIIYQTKDESCVIFDLTCNRFEKGGISASPVYNIFDQNFTVHGWGLPSTAYDNVNVYFDEQYIGEAQRHTLRRDVERNFPQYKDSRSGWMYNVRIPYRDITKVKNVKICFKKENNIIHSVEKKIDWITPASILEDLFSELGNCNFVFPRNTKIAIFTDIESEWESVKKKFSDIYTVVDPKESQNIIVCSTNWEAKIKDLKKEGKFAVPFWYFCIFTDNMVDYNRLKAIAKSMKAEMRVFLEYIKQNVGRKSILTFGNCQIMSINPLMATSKTIMKEYFIISVKPIQDLDKEEKTKGFRKDFLGEIDLFIYQNVSKENKFSPKLATSELIKSLGENARKICIPNCYFTGYFPQHCHNPYNPYLPQFKNTPCPYGDINIQKLYEENYTADKISEIISAPDYYDEKTCRENLVSSLNELKVREKLCDVVISDFIEQNYKEKLLFFTPNHPSNVVLKELVVRVFRHLGLFVNDIKMENAWENAGRELFIYPSVTRALELEFKKGAFCWWRNVKKEPSTMREYVAAYIEYIKIFKGENHD